MFDKTMNQPQKDLSGHIPKPLSPNTTEFKTNMSTNELSITLSDLIIGLGEQKQYYHQQDLIWTSRN